MSITGTFTYFEVSAGNDKNEHWNWNDKHPYDGQGHCCPHHMRQAKTFLSCEAMELKKQMRHKEPMGSLETIAIISFDSVFHCFKCTCTNCTC